MKKIVVLLLTCIIVLSAGALSGCALFGFNASGVSFNHKEMTFELGAEKVMDKNYITVIPSGAKYRNIKLVSADSRIIEVDENNPQLIKAVGLGKTTLTVFINDEAFSDVATIHVTYAKVNGLSVKCDDEHVKTVGDMYYLPFSQANDVQIQSVLNNNINPSSKISWKSALGENESDEVMLAMEEAFSFSAAKTGQYKITATILDGGARYEDSMYLNVYAPYENASITYSGNLVQESDFYEDVRFICGFTNIENNPEASVEWFVNGEYNQSGAHFVFKPSSAGVYEISAKLNGEEVVGKINLYAKGSIMIQNVTLDFDNCFPKVFVRWDSIGADIDYQISIIDLSDKDKPELAEDFRSDNELYKKFFSGNSVDITSLLTEKGVSIFDNALSIRVKTFGDSRYFAESDYSKPFLSKKININARPYLSSSYFDGNKNRYITSEEEFLDWFGYTMMWRGVQGKNEDKLFIAYRFTNAQELLNNAFLKMHFTGRYSFDGRSSGSVATLIIVFLTDGTPTLKTDNPNKVVDSWDAMRPHINYDANKDISGGIPLAIDDKPKVKVETSEQLYYVAERGYCPDPAPSSVAEKMYNYAQSVVRSVTTYDMTDVEKAHAFYDWIMWRVSYDHKVLEIGEVDQSVKYNSYYLESVFTDTDFFSVCDGMSKAYSLLCNMVGIPCMRVTGNVQEEGHAWNKVKIDGDWYIADCTWGDLSIQNGLDRKSGAQEAASHAYFLVSDSEVPSHVEDDGNFPKTPEKGYNWYDDDFTYNNQTIDFYLDNEVSLNYEANNLAQFMTQSAEGAFTQYSVGPNRLHDNNITVTNYIAFEVRVEKSLIPKFTENTANNPLVSSLKRLGYSLNAQYSFTTINTGEFTVFYFFFRLA